MEGFHRVLPLLLVLCCVTLTKCNYLDLNKDKFMWGVATAAYQIEGATEVDNRGSSIWDEFSKLPGKVANNDNADVADLSYYKYMDDIHLMKSLNVKHYRFSISWSRIFPSGKGKLNAAGVLHYNTLINSLVANGIAPVVTLYHWDLPQGLEEEYLGWLGAQIVDDFAAYADTCFRLFGDRVHMWITLNEPWTFIVNGYVSGVFAPGRCSNRTRCAEGDSAREGYVVAHNALKAHAKAVQLYRSRYAASGGVIGITLNIDWAYPLDPSSAADHAAAQRRNEFTFSWFADPIYFGSYPQSMRDGVGDRLPTFTAAEVSMIQGSTDFIGLNHYSSWFLKDGASGEQGWFGDQRATSSKYDLSGALIGPQGGSVWLNLVPEGMFKTASWVSSRYSRPIIVITENGCDMLGEDEPRSYDAGLFSFGDGSRGGSRGGQHLHRNRQDGDGVTSLEMLLDRESQDTKALLMDDFRVEYFRLYLHQVARAVQSGVDIRGYFAWSLLDNFEWADGFNMRFGLFRVNFTDPERHRSPKLSAFFYRDYIRRHAEAELLDADDEGDENQDLRRHHSHGSHTRDDEVDGEEPASLLTFLQRAHENLFQNGTKLMRLTLNLAAP